MGLVRFRNRKMTYFDLRIRIITVCLLRIRTWRGALLKVLAFIGLRSVSVLINAHKFVRTFLQVYQSNTYGYHTDIEKFHHW